MEQSEIDKTIESASFGNVDAIKQGLANGMDPSAKNSHGWTALHYAVMNGSPALIRLLVEAGADHEAKSPRNQSAIGLAAACGKGGVMKLLVELGADLESKSNNSWTPLHLATKDGKSSAVATLIAMGANLDARDVGECTPLHLASFYGHLEAFTALHKAGAELNAQDDGGSTAVHLVVKAFQNGITSGSMTATASDGAQHEFWFKGNQVGVRVDGKEQEITKTVWEQVVGGRIRPWEKNKNLHKIASMAFKKGLDANIGNSVGCTSLHMLAEIGEMSLLKEGVKAGGDINALSNEKLSVLQLAAKNGHGSLVNWLIKSGAALDNTDSYGYSALHDAAQNGHASIVQALIKAGADSTLTTTREIDGIAVGTTAADLADKGGHTAPAKALRMAMAQ